jgi:hypothetical protein
VDDRPLCFGALLHSAAFIGQWHLDCFACSQSTRTEGRRIMAKKSKGAISKIAEQRKKEIESQEQSPKDKKKVPKR